MKRTRALPVRARAGATYYLSPKEATATVKTDVDWTGAKFIIDDVNCENLGKSPQFSIVSAYEPLSIPIKSLKSGQTHAENPFGRDVYVLVENANHLDYIRKGLNQNSGAPRSDNFVLYADGSLTSPVAFDFTEITNAVALPIDENTLTIRGGEFTTIANQAPSKYTYFARSLSVMRSNVSIANVTHRVEGEIEHGAPYEGFLSIAQCANIKVENCLFTAHRIYETIGSAGLPVMMGSYDINLSKASNVTFRSCDQTTDILDKRYWGLIGSNHSRELLLENCRFSRFDAHCGVKECVLRNCVFGWQCVNLIGFGTVLIENTEVNGYALACLRGDYGSTWHGDIIIRNCVWRPLSKNRALIRADNDGTHDFGYECRLPARVLVDGLTIDEDENENADSPLFIFNDYSGDSDIPVAKRKYMPAMPEIVEVKNVVSKREIKLCENPSLMENTAFSRL